MEKTKKYKRLNLKKRDLYSYIFKSIDVFKSVDKLMQIIPYTGDKASIMNKFEIYKNISHPNIMKIQDWYEAKFEYEDVKVQQALYIISDCKEGTKDIKSKLNSKNKMKDTQILQSYNQLNSAIEYLHQNGIIHKNISAEHVYFDQKKCLLFLLPDVKQIDISLGSKIHLESQSKYYKSPQIIQQNKYSEKSDFWALGTLLIEMCFGQNISKIRQKQTPKTPAYDRQFPSVQLQSINNNQIKDIIKKLIKSDIKSFQTFITQYKHNPIQQKILHELKLNIIKSQFIEIRKSHKNIDTYLRLIEDLQIEFTQKVKTIVLYDLNLKDIYFLYGCNFINLRVLHLSQNQISDISILKYTNLEKLTLLNLRGNKIMDIECVKQYRFPQLLQLNLSNNCIEDISPLFQSYFPQLQSLYLSQNKIKNRSQLIQLLKKFPKLKRTKEISQKSTIPTSTIVNDFDLQQYQKKFT